MDMPGFAAEASLYRSGQIYSRYRKANYTPSGLVPALSCREACGLTAAICGATCAWWNPICELGCALALGICLEQCSSDGDGGGSGGGGGLCCPFGSTCKCGGRCMSVNGRMSCVDGTCLRPNQSCP